MSIFILTWNPDESNLTEDASLWSTGSRKSGIAVGDRGYFLRTRRDRGIIASCTFTEEISLDGDWRGIRALVPYVGLVVDYFAELEDRLTVEALKRDLSGVPWDRLQGSGTLLSEAEGRALDKLWAKHRSATAFRSVASPSEPRRFTEGATRTVKVNRFERSSLAREKCLKHYGRVCSVCDFDFGKHYPGIGEGFIEVHHLRDLASIGRSYDVDPIRDLRPVCPNCHEMLHRGVERPRSISVLRRRYQS